MDIVKVVEKFNDTSKKIEDEWLEIAEGLVALEEAAKRRRILRREINRRIDQW